MNKYRRFLAALSILGSVFSLAAPLQAVCTSAKPGILAVWNYIKVQKAANLPPSIAAAADSAAAKWATQCGVGYIPEFWTASSNPPASYSVVNLLYDPGASPVGKICGTFVGSDITIYEYYRKADGSLGHCTQQNLTDIVAHEFGHRLGLDDAGTASSCQDNIMAPVNGLDHQISSDECDAANTRNSTDAERNGGCDSAIDCHMSPILFNLTGGPWRLTGSAGGVDFDYDGDGEPTRTGWTAAGEELAFLFTDLNGDGCATTGRELFGDSMEVAGIGTYLNGFEALAPWDSNRDGWVSPADAGWSRLRLWIDRDHNGQCSTSEVTLPYDEGVLGIDLSYREHRRRDVHGNEFRLVSRALSRSQNGHLTFQRIFDVYFTVENP